MKKVTILAVAMLALSASMAMAQVNLYVGDCGAGTSVATVTNACTSNTGTAFSMFGSVIVPTQTRVGFVGTVGVLDVQTTASGNIDDWWRGDVCRSAGFGLASDATMGGTCATMWDTNPPAGNNITTVYGAEGAPANRIRFLLGTVLSSDNAYDLTGDGTTELSNFKFTVLRSKSVGLGACAGCATPACIVLQEINLETLTDTPATFVRLTTPIANKSVTYNGFSGGACPSTVPVQNRTWGSVKALYR